MKLWIFSKIETDLKINCFQKLRLEMKPKSNIFFKIKTHIETVSNLPSDVHTLETFRIFTLLEKENKIYEIPAQIRYIFNVAKEVITYDKRVFPR